MVPLDVGQLDNPHGSSAALSHVSPSIYLLSTYLPTYLPTPLPTYRSCAPCAWRGPPPASRPPRAASRTCPGSATRPPPRGGLVRARARVRVGVRVRARARVRVRGRDRVGVRVGVGVRARVRVRVTVRFTVRVKVRVTVRVRVTVKVRVHLAPVELTHAARPRRPARPLPRRRRVSPSRFACRVG